MIVAVIEETNGFSQLFASLKSFEQRLLIHSENSVESGFQFKMNFNSKNAEKNSSNNRSSANSSWGGRSGRESRRGAGGRGNLIYNDKRSSREIFIPRIRSEESGFCRHKQDAYCWPSA